MVATVLPPERRELETSIRKTQQEENNNLVWSTPLLQPEQLVTFKITSTGLVELRDSAFFFFTFFYIPAELPLVSRFVFNSQVSLVCL